MAKELAPSSPYISTGTLVTWRENKREKNTVQKPQPCPDHASLPVCSQSPLNTIGQKNSDYKCTAKIEIRNFLHQKSNSSDSHSVYLCVEDI